MAPYRPGGKIEQIGGGEVIKTVLIIELIKKITNIHGVIAVFGRVSECTHEGKDLQTEMKESAVTNERCIIKNALV